MSDNISVVIESHVASVEIHRPPNNFFDLALITDIADCYETLDANDDCRAIVLCSEGKHFCAGADFGATDSGTRNQKQRIGALYASAVRLFRCNKPVVAAVQGGAIGGGLGLALSADFRVTCMEGRFCANFARLGFHQGFGLSVTLPRLVGQTNAARLLYTGQRVKGDEALAMGLADRLVDIAQVRAEALSLASEIAASAPLAVQSIRKTLRGDLADQVARATDHELTQQTWLRSTADFAEGVEAMSERRLPRFKGE